MDHYLVVVRNMVDKQEADSTRNPETTESTLVTTSRRRFMQVTGGLGAAGLLSSGALNAQGATDDNVIKLEAVRVGDERRQGPPDHAGQPGRPDHSGQRGPPDHANDPDHAWVGVEPEEIADETNPTLSLVAGEDYTVEWTNTDGRPHNFTIEDTNGKKIVSSTVLGETGATQTVEFTATEEMAEYYCQPHPHDMRGTIQVDDQASFDINILVFSATAGYRHGNIEYGIQQLQGLTDRIAAETGADSVTIDTIPQDASAFPSNATELGKYDTIIWFNTTGDVLDADQQTAFEEYIRNGGGYAGIHAASDTEYDWNFYGDMLGGAYFANHPAVQEAEIHVTDRTHPSTDHLPARWTVTDEWYDYQNNPRGDVHVLASLDEDSYDGATMDGGYGSDHPIAWCQTFQGGRAWYTGRGHTESAFDEDGFIEHVLGGILWSGGFANDPATGTIWNNYETTPLYTDTANPAILDIAPDGRVFYIERGTFNGEEEQTGEVVVIDPETGEATTALELSIYAGQEDGLLGLLLDSEFENTGWVYLYYSPPNAAIDEPHNRLSRFAMENGSIDPSSEVTIQKVHTQRQTCCHTGGDMHWGPNGEQLYLTTGDDTNPFESDGYTPIDERDGRKPYDAQRTAANTADLRGKILRIIPQDDGSYAIPDDNLFTEDGGYAEEIEEGLVRPEIYTMGNRNPYRASVDHETGTLYWGDYGPDAGSWNAERGPPATVEFNKADAPGFYGWPYFVGPNVPYKEYDFDTGESGDPFDPSSPTNGSPNNDGLTDLPTSEEAMIYYPATWSNLLNAPDYAEQYLPDKPPFPQLQGGAPMAGPLYRHQDGHDPNRALTRAFDGKLFVMEWNVGWIKCVSFDDDGNVMEIDPFLPTLNLARPMDMKVGPDGALYVIDWGSGFNGENSDSGIYRIEHSTETAKIASASFTLDNDTLDPEESTTGTVQLENISNSDLSDIQFTATSSSNVIQVTAPSQTNFDSLAPGESQAVEYDIAVGTDAMQGTYGLEAEITFVHEGNEEAVAASAMVTVPKNDDGGGGGGDGDPIDPSTTIQVDGDIQAWQGVAPDGINGQENPTLTLQEGAEYTVEWTNIDGAPHDFALQDADGNNLAKTDIISEEGATTPLTFTASAEMVQYICTVHPNSMVGDVEVV